MAEVRATLQEGWQQAKSLGLALAVHVIAVGLMIVGTMNWKPFKPAWSMLKKTCYSTAPKVPRTAKVACICSKKSGAATLTLHSRRLKVKRKSLSFFQESYAFLQTFRS